MGILSPPVPSAFPDWCNTFEEKLFVTHGLCLRYGAIPLVGVVSAALRLIAGVVEAVVGLVFVAISLCLLLFKPELGKEALAWSGMHVLQGLKRVVTAPLVAIPGLIFCLGMTLSDKNIENFT